MTPEVKELADALVQPSRAVPKPPRKPSRSPSEDWKRGAVALEPWVESDWPERR